MSPCLQVENPLSFDRQHRFNGKKIGRQRLVKAPRIQTQSQSERRGDRIDVLPVRIETYKETGENKERHTQ